MSKNQQPDGPNSDQQPGAPEKGNETPGSASTLYYAIEELRDKKHTPASIFSGVRAAFGWRAGKMVTEERYDDAVQKFSGAPIGRKVEQCSEM